MGKRGGKAGEGGEKKGGGRQSLQPTISLRTRPRARGKKGKGKPGCVNVFAKSAMEEAPGRKKERRKKRKKGGEEFGDITCVRTMRGGEGGGGRSRRAMRKGGEGETDAGVSSEYCDILRMIGGGNFEKALINAFHHNCGRRKGEKGGGRGKGEQRNRKEILETDLVHGLFWKGKGRKGEKAEILYRNKVSAGMGGGREGGGREGNHFGQSSNAFECGAAKKGGGDLGSQTSEI